jgi:MtrB/PioB family decaheme-associated outer membrane protein
MNAPSHRIQPTPCASLLLLCLSSGLCAQTTESLLGSVEASLGYLDQDAWQFGNHHGVNDRGFTPFINFDLLLPGLADTDSWHIEAHHLGLSSARLMLKGQFNDNQSVDLNWRQISGYDYKDALTPFQNTPMAEFTLPGNWQVTDNTTAGMTSVAEHLNPVSLKRKRHWLELDYQRNLDEKWALNVDFRRDSVTATQAFGAATGSTGGNVRAVLLAAPVDHQTHQASISLAYLGSRFNWTLDYRGSFFDNTLTSVTWPTAFGQHPQWAAGVGFPDGINRMASEPDNQAHQLSARGNYSFTPYTRLYLDAALGRQSQNQSFLPYTANSSLIVDAPLPMQSLDGRVDTTNLNLRLSSRPLSDLNLIVRLEYRDRDNQTPVAAYQRVVGDAAQQQSFTDARLNRPYSLSKRKANIEASWRLMAATQLQAGYHYTDTRRDYSEITRARENDIRLGFRSHYIETLALAVGYSHQQRRTDDYIGNRPLIQTHVPGTIETEEFENHPLLRKYYLSERDRDSLSLQADWYPQTALSVGAQLSWNQDTYPDGHFGLNSSKLYSVNGNISYITDKDWQLSGFYSFDNYQYQQSGRSFRGFAPAEAFDPQRNWQVSASDDFQTVGFNLERQGFRPAFSDWQAKGTLDLSMSFNHSRSVGEIVNHHGNALQSEPLPDLKTELNTAKLTARYHLSASSSAALTLIRETYDSEDFALDNVAVNTLSNVLLPGQQSPRYQATWLGLSYRYEY